MATNFFTTLINAGITPQDATVLDQAFQTEKDFLDGLETISTWLALKQTPGMLPPTGCPWRDIYTHMTQEVQAGTDLDSAYSNSLHSLPADVQISITKAVSVRMKAILDFESQKGNTKRFKTKDYLQQLKLLNYQFKLNELDDTLEVNGQPITDGLAATIRQQLRDAGMHRVNEAEDAYLAWSWKNKYHPVKEYLTSLAWDGQPNIDQLSLHFHDKFGMFPAWIRKWLIGAVAKVFEAEQNPMLVIDGKQGIGKSEFVKWLARPMINYFTEGPINTDDKDCAIRLAKYWIWEVSELGATTRKADYEALKAFLTTRKITVRKPYGRHDMTKPALCSFVGTINNSSGIFSDPTGSRRFLVSHILSIDWDYVNLDPDQIWAEAMAAYLSGEKWLLTKDQHKKSMEINEEYDVAEPLEGILKKYFDIDPNQITWWMSTTDILEVLEDPILGRLKGTSKGNAMALSGAMTKLNLEKRKQNNPQKQRVWGYVGIRRNINP